VEQETEAERLLDYAECPNQQMPLVLFPDGERLAQATNVQVAEKIGLQTQAQKPFYDTLRSLVGVPQAWQRQYMAHQKDYAPS
jgi:thioredoxin reductase (NADPH)